MKVNYNFVTAHLQKDGHDVNPDEVAQNVRQIALAATIPPWSRQKWDSALFGKFGQCKRVYCNKGKDDDDSDSLRMMFTHQLNTKLGAKDVKGFAKVVKSVLIKGTKALQHKCVHVLPVNGTDTEAFNTTQASRPPSRHYTHAYVNYHSTP